MSDSEDELRKYYAKQGAELEIDSALLKVQLKELSEDDLREKARILHAEIVAAKDPREYQPLKEVFVEEFKRRGLEDQGI